MACNCTTKEEIDAIYDAYKVKMSERGKNLKENINRAIMFVFSIFMWIIAIPLTFIYVVLVVFWQDHPKINVQTINLIRIFNFLKNV
jgi:hypothetical protein